MELVKRYALPKRAVAGLGSMRQTLYSAIWAVNRIKGTIGASGEGTGAGGHGGSAGGTMEGNSS